MSGTEELGLIPATRRLLKRVIDRPKYAFGDVPVTSDQYRDILEKDMQDLLLGEVTNVSGK